MKNNKLITIILLIIISVVLIAAAPRAKSDLVSLRIENQSDDYATLRLQGPRFYYLSVPPDTTITFTIMRGDYDQKFYSCQTFVDTTLDLTKKNEIVVPPCGEKAYTVDKGLKGLDAGNLIKLVKVTFENPTQYNLVLILRGPAEHVFFLRADEEASYTIAKGTYEATQWGCPSVKNFDLLTFANRVKELSCPSQ
jgi:hypothetical protein